VLWSLKFLTGRRFFEGGLTDAALCVIGIVASCFREPRITITAFNRVSGF
jgi:hypothetical protein